MKLNRTLVVQQELTGCGQPTQNRRFRRAFSKARPFHFGLDPFWVGFILAKALTNPPQRKE
jgi:hypothetical protein